MADSDAVATKTKVVIIVTPGKAPAARTTPVQEPAPVAARASERATENPPVPDPFEAALARDASRATAETAEIEVPRSAQDTATIQRPALETPHQPVPRERTPEDDELLGAVIMVDLTANPSPLTDFLGSSLLYRTARVASDVGAPRLLLIGNIPAERRDEIYETAYRGFREGVVELTGADPSLGSLGRGRVLLLDGTALHDSKAVERLTRVRGEKTSLLLGQHGDGLKVATAEGKILEIGSDVSPFDGVMVGAASTPAEEFERITRVGERSALRTLGENGLLVGTVVSETFARQFRDEERIERAEVECFNSLASSGNEGLFEDLVGRPFARLITLKLLRTRSVSPSSISVVAGMLALLSAGLLAMGHAGLALFGAVLAIVSAILDRSDGELARLRLDDDDQRSLDFGLDHITHALLFLGLAVGVAHPASGVGGWSETLARLPAGLRELIITYDVQAVTAGLIAAGGVLLVMAVLLWRGEPSPNSRGIRRMGDFIATSFGSRDYFYLLFGFAFFNWLPGMAETGVMGLFLLLTAALVHVSWVLLLFLSVLAPKPATAA